MNNISANVSQKSRPTHSRSNAIFLKISGGRLRAYSLLKHVGRKSGKEYRTPVSAFPLGDGFVLAILYGDAAEVDWVRNVMQAGKCMLKTNNREYTLVQPELITPAQAMSAYSWLYRTVYRLQGVRQFLWVHRAAE